MITAFKKSYVDFCCDNTATEIFPVFSVDIYSFCRHHF